MSLRFFETVHFRESAQFGDSPPGEAMAARCEFAERLRARRYGVIEIASGQLIGIHLRPYPRIATALDVVWLGPRRRSRKSGDRVWLYYNQPWRHPRYLAVTYAESTRDCRHATLAAALAVLDEVARIKGVDALLCDAWNPRLSERLLARYGWTPHLDSRWHRNFIKRFYGQYPEHPELPRILNGRPFGAAPVA